ncbi:hypothetical protein PSHT_10648 [Puccinia striiformis]|uniref:Uncharacterized protein n=1 Tax=Puccinia striiformis TaxID=27350 RepID=A0A2S4V878_9BASI|nr:hypothetical protein PSHT_10648 [Puccinia striiformis]
MASNNRPKRHKNNTSTMSTSEHPIQSTTIRTTKTRAKTGTPMRTKWKMKIKTTHLKRTMRHREDAAN